MSQIVLVDGVGSRRPPALIRLENGEPEAAATGTKRREQY
jgi:hypothetical protein